PSPAKEGRDGRARESGRWWLVVGGWWWMGARCARKEGATVFPHPGPSGQARRAWRSSGLHGNAVQAGPPYTRKRRREQSRKADGSACGCLAFRCGDNRFGGDADVDLVADGGRDHVDAEVAALARGGGVEAGRRTLEHRVL